LASEINSNPGPQYDVISIKPSNPDDRGLSISGTNNTFLATNVSVGLLLQNAYGLRQNYIYGIPSELNTKRFDIIAKIINASPEELQKISGDQRRTMLQTLLKERFGLRAHESVAMVPSFALVLAKGGPRFKKTYSNSQQKYQIPTGSITVGNGELTARGIPMSSLISSLAGAVQRNVIDHTNLSGNFDFHLIWNPAQDESGATEDMRPSIYTALQEQLGLKLIPIKSEVKTLIVDHLESPESN
jgi:uncharacterized protein (TIGR03435 family)